MKLFYVKYGTDLGDGEAVEAADAADARRKIESRREDYGDEKYEVFEMNPRAVYVKRVSWVDETKGT